MIEKCAFRKTRLTSIIIPSSVEVLCKKCFCDCQSLTSVVFEQGSKLQRIEGSAFTGSGLKSIEFPFPLLMLSCSGTFLVFGIGYR
jgi:hypothetical protein